MALNTMNWLSSDEDLISIRPQRTGRSTHYYDGRAIQLGAYSQPVPATDDCRGRRILGFHQKDDADIRGLRYAGKSKMKIRGLIVAVVLLAALTGALYWSNYHKSAETAQTPADLPPKILSLKPDDIVGIAIKKKDSDEVVLKKDGNNSRSHRAPSTCGGPVGGVHHNFTAGDARLQRLVEDKAADLGQYGLAQPSLSVSIAEKNNQTQQLLIGDDTPTGNGVYTRLRQRSAGVYHCQL